MRNLKVLITVVDKASDPLDKVSKKVKSAGKAASETTVDFTKFNKTLFTTAAFVGTFVKGITSLSRSLEEGANLDRITNQFERVMGPRGTLFQAIDSMTDASIDKMEALRSGISLGNLGIIKDTKTLASVVINAGVAAKMAGKDSAEGIQQYTEFLKTGNISNLQFLDLIAHTNPALQAQMAILGKTGGVMGQVVTTQARLALGQRLLQAATKGQLKGFRDLKDSIFDIKQAWSFLRGEVGQLLGRALAPLIDAFTGIIWKAQQFVENIRKNHKEIVFLTKTFLVATGAILGLAAALGTLRLATIALGSLGFGLPKLIALTFGLGSAFIGITKSANTFTDKLKLLGAVFKGVYELVTSLNSETGISKMTKSTYFLLKQNGLLGFVQFLGRSISVVKRVTTDMFESFRWLSRKVDDIFGGIARTIISLFEKINAPWENFWVSEALDPVSKFVRSATVLLMGFGTFVAGMFGKKLLTGALGKIPLLGRMFGGAKGNSPTGSKNDPIHTRNVDKLPSVGLLEKLSPTNIVTNLFSFLKKEILGLAMIFEVAGGGIRGVLSIFSNIISGVTGVISKFIMPIVIFGSALMGAAQGIFNTAADWKAFFGGIFDLGKAVLDVSINAISSFSKWISDTIPGLSYVIDGLKFLGENLFYLPKMIMDGWRMIFEALGSLLGPLGTKLTEWAKVISPDSFKTKTKQELPKIPEANKNKAILPEIAGMNIAGKNVSKTATVTSQPDDPELEALNKLGESLQATPNSAALSLQKQYEQMLNKGNKPSDIVSNVLGNKIDDTNQLLEGILRNTLQNRSLQGNPMSKREQ